MKTSLTIVTTLLALASAAFAEPPPTMGHTDELALVAAPSKASARLTVNSPSFKDADNIPLENTQYGRNVFPGLIWTAGPKGTLSYVVIIQGESLKGSSSSIHLTLFNVPSHVTKLDAGMTTPPSGSTYGPNVHGLNQPYAGPHTHTSAKQRYHFQVFALDTVIESDRTLSFEAVESAVRGHVLASGELVGLAAGP